MTPHEDYTTVEINEPERISFRKVYDDKIDWRQIHILSYLGSKWGQGNP
jgi:hypothetical protein